MIGINLYSFLGLSSALLSVIVALVTLVVAVPVCIFIVNFVNKKKIKQSKIQ